ncbi:MAG TPA: hypothetical protein VIH90_04205 [Candidatus Saccharimonadales bacterium]
MKTQEIEVINLEPVSFLSNVQMVGEGFFAVCDTEDADQLATVGLYICKGISIYNSSSQRGTLAHLAYTRSLKPSLDSIVDGFGEDLTSSDVLIVGTEQSAGRHWPDIDSIAQYFLKHNPRSLTVDRNIPERSPRSMAIRLSDGKVSEVDLPSARAAWLTKPNTSLNQPILDKV